MSINSLIIKWKTPIQFSENIDNELEKLSAELRVVRILGMLASEQPVTDEVKADLRHMMLVLADLFSSSVPPIEENPMEMLSLAARDINFSRLLKERGLARVYRLITLQAQVYDGPTQQNILLPAFMQERNPETGQQFTSREEFIGWFCREARVPRSLVFMRMATYDRLQTVGMSLEEAFAVIIKKPYASREVLNEVATWQRGELANVDPDVAVRLARAMIPEQAGEIEALADIIRTTTDLEELETSREELFEAVKPALKQLVEEVADHPSMRDAMAMVRHDIAARPEIDYWYDAEHGWFVAEYVRKAKDVRGNNYVADIEKYNLIPEIQLPAEVAQDIASRLSVKNRGLLDN